MLTPSLINNYVGFSNIKLFICDVSEYCNISNGNSSHSFSKLNPDLTISRDVVGLLPTLAEVGAHPSHLVHLLSQVEPKAHILFILNLYHRICYVNDPPTRCHVLPSSTFPTLQPFIHTMAYRGPIIGTTVPRHVMSFSSTSPTSTPTSR